MISSAETITRFDASAHSVCAIPVPKTRALLGDDFAWAGQFLEVVGEREFEDVLVDDVQTVIGGLEAL